MKRAVQQLIIRIPSGNSLVKIAGIRASSPTLPRKFRHINSAFGDKGVKVERSIIGDDYPGVT
jgi:hypothetical protein